jgi:hypothetical protein
LFVEMKRNAWLRRRPAVRMWEEQWNGALDPDTSVEKVDKQCISSIQVPQGRTIQAAAFSFAPIITVILVGVLFYFLQQPVKR